MHDMNCQCDCEGGECACQQSWPAMYYLKAALLVVLIVAGLFLIRNWYKSYRYIGMPETRDTITVEGVGKVTALPDVATFNVGVQTEKVKVTDAQKENTEKMNKIVTALKDLGVAKEDIQTSQYSIYPQYDWYDNRQTLRGYQVSQVVTVKVRDLSKVGDIFAKAGDLGANTVDSLQFTLDDPEQFKQEARMKALKNAKEKANALSDAAGVKLGKVVGFSEYTMNPEMPAYGFGGGGMMDSAVKAMPAPAVEAGNMQIVINATVSYEVL